MSQSDDDSNPIGPVEPYAPIKTVSDQPVGQPRSQPGDQRQQPKPRKSPNGTHNPPEPAPLTGPGGSRGGQIDELA